MVQSPGLELVGYWSGPDVFGSWPSPEKFIDLGWDDDERDLVADYLSRGFVARAFMGFSRCRICGCDNGSLELTDGTYIWPEGFAHYLSAHLVRPPLRFVEHVTRRLAEFEEAPISDEWWGSLSEG